MTGAVDLAVVIISHGHEAMLPACITSLASALEGLTSEILVIDNLPAGHVRAAVAGLPVRVMTNATSVGFAANVNAGAAATSGRMLLLLNPDTEHHTGSLAEAVRFLDRHVEVGLLGCGLVGEDGAPQQSFRRFPSPAVPIVRGLGIDRWPWQPAWYRRRMMSGVASDQPFAVDWIFGAFLLMRRADFDRVGGMDAGYRLYYEDVDLAWRLRQRGLATWVYPPLVFRHAHQRASAKRPFSRSWWWHLGSAVRYFSRTIGRTPPRLSGNAAGSAAGAGIPR